MTTIRQLIFINFLLLTSYCVGQTTNSFSIRQVILPGGHISDYIYQSNTLIIKENGKKKKTLKLKQEQIKEIDSIVNLINPLSLEESYSRPVIDGIYWVFKFEINQTKKEIILNNYYLEKLDILVRHINGFVDDKSQLISFGDEMHTKSDTLIRYLPDFYLTTVEMPDTNYDFYSIMCFGKGYSYTFKLDEIELCDCRIYPTNKESQYKKRAYWRAFRQENGIWKREYYDNDNNVFKTDFIYDLLPYEIIKEKIEYDYGNKPSVTITRYYRTETN